MTELARQLAQLREKNLGASSAPIHQGAPSIFLDAKEAAKVDIPEVLAAATKGLDALMMYDKRLSRFSTSLLHENSVNLQRQLKTAKENEELNVELSAFLSQLSLYSANPSMHLVLEYLIRR